MGRPTLSEYEMPKGVYERKPKEDAMPETEEPKGTTITWLGEDDSHDGEGPEANEWRGITFVKGQPVEVDDQFMIEKAKSNPFYLVD